MEKVVREEEEAFLRTLDKGIKIFNEYIEQGASQKLKPTGMHKKESFPGLSLLN